MADTAGRASPRVWLCRPWPSSTSSSLAPFPNSRLPLPLLHICTTGAARVRKTRFGVDAGAHFQAGERAHPWRSRVGYCVPSGGDYALLDRRSDLPHFAGTRAVGRRSRLSEVCAWSVHLGGRLRRDLGCVLALGGLLGHAEHRSDLGPGSISPASIADGVEQRRVDVVSLFHQFGDGPKRCSLRLDEIISVDVVGPTLEGVGSLCT